MNNQYFILITLLVFVLIGCNTPTENSSPALSRFPKVFLEAGSDSDSSYISLRTVRLRDGNLKTEATGWGVEEYGLFLNCRTENGSLTMHIMGKCGTVFTQTWVKRTFEYLITRTSEDTLQRIQFTNFRDTLTVAKK